MGILAPVSGIEAVGPGEDPFFFVVLRRPFDPVYPACDLLHKILHLLLLGGALGKARGPADVPEPGS